MSLKSKLVKGFLVAAFTTAVAGQAFAQQRAGLDAIAEHGPKLLNLPAVQETLEDPKAAGAGAYSVACFPADGTRMVFDSATEVKTVEKGGKKIPCLSLLKKPFN